MSEPKFKIVNTVPAPVYFQDIPDGVFFRERGQPNLRMKLGDKQLWLDPNGRASLHTNWVNSTDDRYVLVSVELHVTELP